MSPLYYPPPFYAPILVPKPASIDPFPARPLAPKVGVDAKYILAVAAVLLFLPEKWVPSAVSSVARRPATSLGALPKRARGNRLYYMYKPLFQDRPAAPKAIPRSQARKVIAKLRKGDVEGWLWAVWAKSADDARLMVKRGEARPYEPTMGDLSGLSDIDLSGAMMSCGVWQPVWSEKGGAEVWRCLKYGASCGANGSCEVSGNKLKQCVRHKQVFSKFYEKEISRCAEFKPVCNPRGCLPAAMPKPEIRLQKNIDAQVKDVARDMADDANKKIPYLTREILSRGGIQAHRRGVAKEEYSLIPLHLKRSKSRGGLMMDEMAAEMGMSEDELYELIRETYPGGMAKRRKQKKRRFVWQDFEEQARSMVTQAEESYRELGDAEKWIPRGLKKGAFTAQAKRAGMGTQEFAEYVLDNPEHFQRKTVSRARLARTFARMSRGEYSVNGLDGVGLNTINAVVRFAKMLTNL